MENISLIPLEHKTAYQLSNGDSIRLSPMTADLHQHINLESYLSRIIKQQQNEAIRRQIFQEWIIESYSGTTSLSIRDRYNEYIYHQSFALEPKIKQKTRLYLIHQVLYHPDELK